MTSPFLEWKRLFEKIKIVEINAIVRMAYIAQSKVLDLQGPILHDFFQINRYLTSDPYLSKV
jgi:hypothetical protein